VVVFGLGAVGLSVIQMAAKLKANPIIGVDVNPGKFECAKALGATICLESNAEIKQKLLDISKWGFDFTFDCTGIVDVMRVALEVSHRGWGESCVIGVAESGKEISTRPFQLVTGRSWKGTAFGGWKARTEVPKLINRALLKDLDL
jgi:Zn-dependent alcohol dehydrogenase